MAKVLSSISGNLISAASAGYAPTNSGDVSAIASAYQVVSATATQLYAGTAHVTSINGDPISASRAGNAANASMATSAYYDGTGRLISALPDAATVSSIASSYAESAASGKLDKTAQVVSATAGDGTYITSINGMGLSGQGGGGGGVVTATGSASATEGYWPYTTSYLVSSINGSAVLPYGYSALSSNSSNWNSTRTTVSNNSANWNSVYNTVNNNSASWTGSTGGGSVTSPSGTIVVMNGNEIEGTNSAVVTASGTGFDVIMYPQVSQLATYMQLLADGIVPDTGATLMIPLNNYAYADIHVILSGRGTGYGYVSASGIITSGDLTANIPMDGIVSDISASAENWVPLSNFGLTAKKDGGIFVTGVRELAWQSAVDNVTITVANNSASWGQGGVDSATVSSIASSYAKSAVSGVESTVSANSATWGHGGVDSATVSAIASAYQVVSSTASGSGEIFGQTAFYATEINGLTLSAQEASLATYATNAGSAGAAPTNSSEVSAIASGYATGKADSSALSSYALSADVSGTIDTVSSNSASWAQVVTSLSGNANFYNQINSKNISATVSYKARLDENGNSISALYDTVSAQSANWGGSALALSAGPGVSLTKSGNTLIAGLDETLLWSGSIGPTNTAEMAYPLTAFERVRVTWFDWDSNGSYHIEEFAPLSHCYPLCGAWFGSPQTVLLFHLNMSADSTYTTISFTDGVFAATTGTSYNSALNSRITKIVGINRTAGV